jgi:hypothetical protein
MAKNKRKLIQQKHSASHTPDKHSVARVQRKHKDTLFRFIFRDKTKLLQLYNAINRIPMRHFAASWRICWLPTAGR